MGTNEQRPRVVVPRDKVAGVYASGVDLRHTGEVFILDFIVQDDSSDLGGGDFLVVQRVRLHPDAVQSVLMALNTQLGVFEQTYGPPRGGHIL